MIVLEKNIESLIPQRSPFVMISNLIEAGEKKFETDFFIRPNNLFIKNGLLQEAALIENIAQTCAAGFGYLNSKAGGQTMLGFIGAITKLKVHALPKVNTTITTKVIVTHQLENVYLIKGQNSYLGKELLECEMKIVIN
jgi:predicted hotdog family 3-hydroxylacyl-ACP dehydratase